MKWRKMTRKKQKLDTGVYSESDKDYQKSENESDVDDDFESDVDNDDVSSLDLITQNREMGSADVVVPPCFLNYMASVKIFIPLGRLWYVVWSNCKVL